MPALRMHKLELYERAVQSPSATVELLLTMYSHHRGGALPCILREDFAGSAALARTWVQIGGNMQAMAVEHHAPTLNWAKQQAKKLPGELSNQLSFYHADVLAIHKPKADIMASLNFSTFGYHDRGAMLTYLRHAKKSLKSGGVLCLDAFGGPGAMRESVQTWTLPAEADEPVVTYHWEQKQFDPATARMDCRIHFSLDDGTQRDNAFRYDWRLWTLPELCELMLDAGFADVSIWADSYDAKSEASDGVYQPVTTMSAREDWVAYVVGVK